MIISTTPTIQGKEIRQYFGVVTGEAIMGANVFKDVFASITDIVGGRSGSYERELQKARQIALDEMAENAKELGANAIVGVDVDYEVIRGGMLMVAVSGTAVSL